MKYPLRVMTVTDDDAMLLETLIGTVEEHRPVHEADDPIALAELLADARKLLERMTGTQPSSAAKKPMDWTGVPY